MRAISSSVFSFLVGLLLCVSCTLTATHQNDTAQIPDNDTEIVQIKHTVKRVVPIMFSRPPAQREDSDEMVCSKSVDDFPDFFTEEQRKNGAIALAFVIAIYCFTIIAIICDNYFLPCVERICETLNLTQDVAAATFICIATIAPEMFVNVIGTFVTESDIGIGTIVGSSMFNTLGVAAIGALFASKPIQLDWWPVTRDSVIYIFAIVLLIVVTWDGTIYWYEGLVLVCSYIVYFCIMFQNVRISAFFKGLVANVNAKWSSRTVKVAAMNDSGVSEMDSDNSIKEIKTISAANETYINVGYYNHVDDVVKKEKCEEVVKVEEGSIDDKVSYESNSSSCTPKSCLKKVFYIYSWPIRVILHYTIPDSQKYKRIYPLTFVICVLLIALNSYIVSWMITTIGDTLNISDAVLGLTFLAAGSCVPEAIMISIMIRKGEGSMGVSNSLGGNTMNILLSLGMPWFLKTLIVEKAKNPLVIESGSIEYTIVTLIGIALVLYLSLYFNKFRLSRRLGFILLAFYSFFLALAILMELVFFDLPKCPE